jgi:hypothetical protein
MTVIGTLLEQLEKVTAYQEQSNPAQATGFSEPF